MTNNRQPQATNPRELRLSLLENGLDFIREGVEALYGRFDDPPPHAYKYALLNIFSGTLLILKERLRRAHPSLIFKDVGQQVSPDAKTVDFDEVLRRLEGAAGVALSTSDVTLLKRVQKQRNTLEHFEAQLNVEHVNSLVGELVEFLERFLREQLGESIFKHVSDAAGREIGELAKIAERLQAEHLAEWQGRAARYKDLPDEELESLADTGDYHPKHNPDGGLLECPQCDNDSVAQIEADIGICTNRDCRAILMLHQCDRCGCTTVSDAGEFCPGCQSYIRDRMERD